MVVNSEELVEAFLPLILLIIVLFALVFLALCITGGLLSLAIARQRRAFLIGALAYGAAFYTLSRWDETLALLGSWVVSAAAGFALRSADTRGRRFNQSPF